MGGKSHAIDCSASLATALSGWAVHDACVAQNCQEAGVACVVCDTENEAASTAQDAYDACNAEADTPPTTCYEANNTRLTRTPSTGNCTS